ncbi:type II toxin-antitoxin system VapC family toxin [Limnochorda pilosa]|uniref:Twitching motility protein PilT n=1 Tax=Limnochorda pilosa TaxID=1555112 RepID=A0A0K2SMQ8_LIMPI|nr:type II toxin-antitoxin system VapC family toxin [Limnochorda pilosa]BAS28287.1 twitching motility protein PilT [Limnochorda pilosa]
MILLDTHAWVWWLGEPECLSSEARERIEHAASQNEVYVSSISVWEVAMLVERGRLKLALDVGDWIQHAESLPFIHYVPVDNRIAFRSVTLPEPFHRDPADRIIVATALILGADLTSKDERIQAYPFVKAVW